MVSTILSHKRHIFHQRLTSTFSKMLKMGKNTINWDPATSPPWLAAPNRRPTSQNVAFNRYFPWVLAETTKTNYRRRNLVFNQQQRRSETKRRGEVKCKYHLYHWLYYCPGTVAKKQKQKKQTTGSHHKTNTNNGVPFCRFCSICLHFSESFVFYC